MIIHSIGRIARTPIFASFLIATVVQAQPLQPSGGWNVDYGETQCIALRKFGSKEDGWMFGVRPSFNKESFELMISREGSGPSSIEQDSGAVDFGSGPIKTQVLRYKTPDSRISVQRYRVSADELRRKLNAREVMLSIGSKSMRFSLQGFAQVVKALDTCLADLRQHWNSDTALGTGAKSAKGDVRRLFTGDDYPAIALLENHEGQATFILLVDEKGKVAGCDLARPSGVPVLDVMGCEVFRKRARFTPARNAAGQPVRDTVVSPPVRWKIM